MTRLRPAVMADLRRLREWRNAPSSRRRFLSPRPVPAAKHARWLSAVLADPARKLWIVESGGVPVGQVRLDLRGATAEVSVTIAPGRRGKGLGSAALAAAVKAAARLGLRRLDAVVLADNPASAIAFLRAGFAFEARARAGGRDAYHMTRRL